MYIKIISNMASTNKNVAIGKKNSEKQNNNINKQIKNR